MTLTPTFSARLSSYSLTRGRYTHEGSFCALVGRSKIMIRAIYTTTLWVFTAGAAWSQMPAFEVASIKPAAPMTEGKVFMGSGGDAGRYTCSNFSLKDLVAQA